MVNVKLGKWHHHWPIESEGRGVGGSTRDVDQGGKQHIIPAVGDVFLKVVRR
jgi:hypothetical protein